MKTLLAGLLLGAAAYAQDWPQHLGPTRDGRYAGSWSEKSSFTPVWTRKVGEGFSAPVVAGGRVILFHREDGQEIVESLDAATGKAQWTFRYPTAYRDDFGFSEGPRGTPAVAGDRVYTYGAEGMLHSLDLASGKKVWSVDARKEYGMRKEFFGTGCSPLVDESRVLMNLGGASDAGIAAFDAATGKLLWKALRDEAGYSSPVAASFGGVRHTLFFTREGLVDADAATGKPRFQYRWRARQQASVNSATPLVSGSEVFLSASYGTGAALLDLATGSPKVVWSGDDSLSNHYATSVLRDGYLYGFHGRQEYGQELRSVEWKTGKVMWKAEGFGAGTVTLAGTHLFLLREDGELRIAPASPKAFQPGRRVKLLSGTVRSYPALAQGRIYARNENTLGAWRID
jgi:outer membrane protein assembly factor BamB